MMIRSAGRPTAVLRGGRTGGRVGRSGGRYRRPRRGNVEQVKGLNGQGNVRNRNGNMGDEAFREMLGMRLWITTRKVVRIRTFSW